MSVMQITEVCDGNYRTTIFRENAGVRLRLSGNALGILKKAHGNGSEYYTSDMRYIGHPTCLRSRYRSEVNELREEPEPN